MIKVFKRLCETDHQNEYDFIQGLKKVVEKTLDLDGEIANLDGFMERVMTTKVENSGTTLW